MEAAVRELVDKRRGRAIRVILSAVEDSSLRDDEYSRVRKVILDELNDLVDMILTVLESTASSEASINALWLERIDQLYDHLGVG